MINSSSIFISYTFHNYPIRLSSSALRVEVAWSFAAEMSLMRRPDLSIKVGFWPLFCCFDETLVGFGEKMPVLRLFIADFLKRI